MRTLVGSAFIVMTLVVSCASQQEQRRAVVRRDQAATAIVDALVAGDYVGALGKAEAELRRRPSDPWLLYDKGAALAGLGRTDEAARVLRKAEATFPSSDLHGRGASVYRLALALEMAGRCNEASTELSRWASLVHPSRHELVEDVTNHVEYCVGPPIAEISRELENAELVALADDPVRRAADQASTAAVRAMVRGDYHTALSWAEEGLQQKPNDAWLLYNEGTALAALGRVPEGLQVLKRAEARFGEAETHGQSVVTYQRALILESIGRCDEAADEFRRYVNTVEPTDPLAAAHARAHLRICRLVNRPVGRM